MNLHSFFKINTAVGRRVGEPSKRSQALRVAGNTIHGHPIYKIDHRALERNIYAPWGRGHLGGWGEGVLKGKIH